MNQRVYLNEAGHLILDIGDYGRDASGTWWVRPPRPGLSMGSLDNHEVLEHEDSTITVSPSLLYGGQGSQTWHGYLEHGEWREV